MSPITSFVAARDALRNRRLRQSLYDDGARLMGPVIVNLHGAAHTDRRRLEHRLFSPETIERFERERLPSIIEREIAQLLGSSNEAIIDMVPMARRVMMRLSVDVAGVDMPDAPGDADAAFDELFELMHRLAQASVVVHATGDKAAIVADGDAALAAFEQRFYRRSLDRRQGAIDRGEPLPPDILTTLLANEDRLDLPPGVVLREVAYYPWVGAHSTAAQFVHALHHVFDWLDAHPHDRARLVDDHEHRLRFVHESLRLHPASPVAVRRAVETTTVDERSVLAGDEVIVSIEQANRDPAVFGPDADQFLPDRRVPAGVPRWGLSFGSGMHACLGRELAGGRAADDDTTHRQGAISMLIGAVLTRGGRRSPDAPHRLDTATSRQVWGTYPVQLTHPA